MFAEWSENMTASSKQQGSCKSQRWFIIQYFRATRVKVVLLRQALYNED
jgi:hypothetical protein